MPPQEKINVFGEEPEETQVTQFQEETQKNELVDHQKTDMSALNNFIGTNHKEDSEMDFID